MTNREYCIIKQFVKALIDVAYARGTVKVAGKNCGCVSDYDASELLNRIQILVEDEDK